MNYYLLGVVVGVIFALGVFFISLYLHKKNHPNTRKYDERQMIGRGKAFQAGFFTLLISGAICNVWDYVAPLPGGIFLWNVGVLLLGITVFAVTAIHYDAYVGMNDSPRRFLAMGVGFIFLMSSTGLMNFHNGRSEGRIIGIANFGVGIVWLIIVAALLLHRRNARKEEE